VEQHFREKYSIDVRVALLEQGQMDLKTEVERFREEVHNTHKEIKDEMKSSARILIGILVFLVTASLLLVVNMSLLAGGVGPG
jgi:hypothetical protein